jgi:hypothetical protein
LTPADSTNAISSASLAKSALKIDGTTSIVPVLGNRKFGQPSQYPYDIDVSFLVDAVVGVPFTPSF